MTSFHRFLTCVLLALSSLSSQAGTLSDTPLSLKGGVPPNVMLALSTEFPTAITAAYQGSNDYSATNEYLGYFDPGKCYSYSAANGYFSPVGITNNHGCSTWSGNFLNWATMTGLDEFRYAMTGGQRVLDTAALTVLERTYISNQGSASSNFPNKTFVENGTTTPFPASAAIITVQNHARGSQMVILPNGGDIANCATPTLVNGTFSCGAMVLNASGTTATCTAWGGNGTSTTPYICTAFTYGGGISGTATKKTTSTASTGSGSSAATVTCTNPGFATPPFSCTLTMGNGATGSCSNWAGSGTLAAPYRCTSFGNFSGSAGSVVFTPSGTGNTTGNFTTTTAGADVTDNVTCAGNVNGPTLSCPMPSPGSASGDKAVCSTFTIDNSNTYKCSGSFGFYNATSSAASNAERYVSHSVKNNSGVAQLAIGGSTIKHYTDYKITYKPNISSTVYYTQTYGGSTGSNGIYYYVSAYDVAFGGSQTYNVRVKVCDSTIGLESNCKQYGSVYKPTGVIQENGDMMRFGVTSYFQADDIDNAVLRSKLKYVAPTKYSAAGQPITNPNAEWSATDGTLFSNPDSTDAATASSFIGASSNTGVINYINKFGSASQSYKTYDTVGKLYYETLKYLRGKTATPDFYKGAKVSNSDGFPVITNWDDPVQFSCQKNYIITIGDTHTWCDKRLPGDSHGGPNNAACNAYTDANSNAHPADFGSLPNDSALSVSALTASVGTLEGVANLATNYTGAGGAGYGMAGLSYWAASKDFRPDIPGTQHVQSYVIDVQEARDCGYRSQFWLTSKYGIPDSYDADGVWLTTGNPAMGTAVLPSGGCASGSPPNTAWPKNLLRAGDPQSMISSVRSALSTIAAQIGDEAALAQSSGTLDTGTGAYIYKATYNTAGWQGDLQALAIDTTGAMAATPAWKASTKLPAPAARNIFTFNDGIAANGSPETTANSRRGIRFDAASFPNLSSRQQVLLNTDQFGVVDGLGADRVSWVRGDQSKEANGAGTTTANPNPNNYGWRSRLPSAITGLTNLLGDVVNSNPVFVAEPRLQIGDGFITYARSIRNRRPAIYVGGNDGMLHAYDASYTVSATGLPQATSTSGTELFAYVPTAVYKNLPQLMAPNYSHKYFVDGSPTVSDACFGNAAGSACNSPTSWKTMLVGGLNAGGQGFYALDVTDPTAFSASKVLWEFTDRDDPDLGYTFSKPLVVQLNNQKWAVIFGNGYNNTVADGSTSADGRAYLYVLYVDGPGNGNRWVKDTNYFKIPLVSPTESATPLSPANGLSSVASVDRDQNGTADILYAGDRYGQLWKIDLASATPSNWRVDLTSNAKPSPLFTAASSGAVQQITTGVEVAFHPNGGFMVMFGTGSWVDTSDPFGPFTRNSLYGIWDKDDHSTIVARSQLQQQKALAYVKADGATCVAGSDDCFVVFSNCQPNYGGVQRNTAATATCPATLVASGNAGTQQLGWYMDLPGTGERTRSSAPAVDGGVVNFTSLMPATDPCAGNTSGIEYNLSYLTGGTPVRPVYVLDNNSTGMILTTTMPGTNSQGTSVIAAGKTTSGGATDLPTKMNSTPPPSTDVVTVCGGTSGVPCGETFIPGWGFLRNMDGPTSNNARYELDCYQPQSGDMRPTCSRKIKPSRFGRLDWRQINR